MGPDNKCASPWQQLSIAPLWVCCAGPDEAQGIALGEQCILLEASLPSCIPSSGSGVLQRVLMLKLKPEHFFLGTSAEQVGAAGVQHLWHPGLSYQQTK